MHNLLLSCTLPVLPISSIGCSLVHVRVTPGVADDAIAQVCDAPMHLRCHEATTLDSSGQAPMDHWAGPFQCFHELGSQCDILCRDCRLQSGLAHSSSLTHPLAHSLAHSHSLSLTVTHFPCAPPTDHESFAGLWCFFASAFSSGQGPGHWWGEESDRLLPHLVAIMRLEFITKRWVQPRIRVKDGYSLG